MTGSTQTTENNFSDSEQHPLKPEVQAISPKLKENEQYIKNSFDHCSDIVLREIKITSNQDYSALCVYLAGMIKQDFLEEAIVKKLS